MKCIYCLEDKAPKFFLKTEHVMLQSFGRFQDNFTLNGLDHPQVVCDCCNQRFGDNLEVYLARDTFEGLYRYELGIKAPEEFKSAGKRSRLKRKVAEGEFKGAYAYLEYSEEQGKIVLKPVPQIGLLKKDSSDYHYFLFDELPHRSTLTQETFDINHPQAIRILACSKESAKETLAQKGFTFEYRGEIEPSDNREDLLCEIEGQIDNIIRRAVAKIAFNYLAFWAGREFVLHSDFDLVRRFIRYDDTPPYPIVLIDDKSILRDERKDKIRVGHIVTLAYAADAKTILSQVSIFNLMRYRVCLAKKFSGLRKDIRRGHFFNIKTMEIWPLEAGNNVGA